MDNLRRAGRETLFDGFLDYVEQQEGQLVILGDFLELLRYPLESIIARRDDLLDRLAIMDTVYVPGNHDEDVFSLINAGGLPHPFFARTSDAFTQCIGNRRFRFMHGHEVDPFVNAGWKNLGRMIGAVTYHFELRHKNVLILDDLRLSTSLQVGDPAVRLRRRIKRGVNKALREGRVRTSAEKVRSLTRQIRNQHMIAQYHDDRIDDLYDVAVVGHTHHAAVFGNWFFNSGSWTGQTNDFLIISPDGEVEVLGWSRYGPQFNREILAA